MHNTKKITEIDLPSIVDIHIQAFSGFFLTSLGKSFLHLYYKSSIKSSECIAICSTDENGKYSGFAIGSTLSKGYHKRLLMKNLFAFGLRFMIVLFTKPNSILRLLKNINKIEGINDDGNYAELLSIGVSKNYKGQGIGKLLIEKFESEALNRGSKKVSLTTDYYDNESVVNFYFSRGYSVFYEFNAYPDRKMYKMIKDLNKI
jgi:ribosomal protein S18 acetylase RimI-like enzyme